jgi:hypothetical protein
MTTPIPRVLSLSPIPAWRDKQAELRQRALLICFFGAAPEQVRILPQALRTAACLVVSLSQM